MTSQMSIENLSQDPTKDELRKAIEKHMKKHKISTLYIFFGIAMAFYQYSKKKKVIKDYYNILQPFYLQETNETIQLLNKRIDNIESTFLNIKEFSDLKRDFDEFSK